MDGALVLEGSETAFDKLWLRFINILLNSADERGGGVDVDRGIALWGPLWMSHTLSWVFLY